MPLCDRPSSDPAQTCSREARGRTDIAHGMRMHQLRARVQRAEYVVDADAVAEAYLRHAVSYSRCWKPRAERGPLASDSVTPAGPAVARPTHVTPTAAAPAALASGTQTHSS